jgi:hypothetical protein
MPAVNKRSPYDLRQSPFFRLGKKSKLAILLQMECSQLVELSNADDLYREWDQKKDNGKIRRIESPEKRLAQVQKRIENVLSRIALPDFLFCPVKGKSYINNARQHVDGIEVRCLDVADYFPSTLSRRVFWFFHSVMECSRDVAGILTSLATYKGHLPTGSPLSPLMSFYAHYNMWLSIYGLAKAAGCIITVYMDDLTISGPKVPNRLMWEIKKKINQNGLQSHKEKRFTGGQACEVTGVILDRGKLKLPHRQHKKMYELRREIRVTPKAAEVELLSRKLRGRIAQASQIARENMK